MKVLMLTNMYPTKEAPSFGCFVKSQIDSVRIEGIEVDILFINGRRWKVNYIRGAWEVFRRSFLNEYDIIHAHYGLSGLLARCQFRFPVVVSFCGTDVMDKFQGRISRFISRFVDACIVKSRGLKQVLNNENAYIIPNGVDLNIFEPMSRAEAKQRLGLSNQTKYILFCGNPTNKVKRFDIAQKTHRILNNYERTSFTDLELLPLYGQTPQVMPLYMNACDVYLLTSDWEGSPNTVKEAMACNLPIVSVDVGDVREIIGDTRNCYVCNQDPVEIAEKLALILENNERTNGRAKIRNLSKQRIARRIISVYQRVVVDKNGKKGE